MSKRTFSWRPKGIIFNFSFIPIDNLISFVETLKINLSFSLKNASLITNKYFLFFISITVVGVNVKEESLSTPELDL